MDIATLWSEHVKRRPDRPVVVQGRRQLTWAQLDHESSALARALAAAGLGHQSKVACLLYNSAEAVVFHTSLAKTVATVREELPGVNLWIGVDDGPALPPWATDWQTLHDSFATGGTPGTSHHEDDIVLIYTGGTTGLPKGVMWRQDDLLGALGAVTEVDPQERLPSPFAGRVMPASPLMHAAGLFSAFATLSHGGCLVLLDERRPGAADVWEAVARHRVETLGLVGDAFARPLVDALDDAPRRWDLSRLSTILSSGVAWSEASKRALLGHLPHLSLVDLLGSTEAIGVGRSESVTGSVGRTGHFTASEGMRIIDEQGHAMLPTPGVQGRLAMSGFLPLGYYKDAAATGATFPTIDGRRYAVPGDFAEVTPTGDLRLLGRGSGCINTGGEKVFAEEVDEVLKAHPAVADAACVGVPDERFGEVVCAVVQARPGRTPQLHELRAHVKERLADFKAPRTLILVGRLDRTAAGKLDYALLRERAREHASAR
jgi:fatty-acyl-CoA synthase